MRVTIIAAVDEANVIGFQGRIPWHVPGEQKYFKEMTMGHVVIMGRKTWESLPGRYRPLPGRTNIVVTSSAELPGAMVANSLHKALDLAKFTSEEVFLIGGAQLYKAALDFDLVDRIFLSRIDGRHKGDTFFPHLESCKWDFRKVREGDGFTVYEYFPAKG